MRIERSELRPRTTVARELAVAIGIALILIPAGHAAAEDDLPSAEVVLQRYIDATGGRAAYDRVRNRVVEATLEIAGAGVTLDVTSYHAKPNLAYSVIESEATGKIERGTDGEVAWELSVMSGPQVMEGAQRDQFLRESVLDKLAYWQEFYTEARTVGVETIDDRACFKVEMTAETGRPSIMYFDRETAIPRKIELVVESPMGEVPTATFPGDWREVDGILIPHAARVEVMGQQRIMTIHDCRHNVDLPADRFALPDDIRAIVAGSEGGTTGG